MQEKINLQKLKDLSLKMSVINGCPYGSCFIEDYINCPDRELEQKETYKEFEGTWGYKSMDFVNVGGNKND